MNRNKQKYLLLKRVAEFYFELTTTRNHLEFLKSLHRKRVSATVGCDWFRARYLPHFRKKYFKINCVGYDTPVRTVPIGPNPDP